MSKVEKSRKLVSLTWTFLKSKSYKVPARRAQKFYMSLDKTSIKNYKPKNKSKSKIRTFAIFVILLRIYLEKGYIHEMIVSNRIKLFFFCNINELLLLLLCYKFTKNLIALITSFCVFITSPYVEVSWQK